MKANNFYDSVAYVAEEIKRKALSMTPEKEIDELYETIDATWNFQITGEDITVIETEGVVVDEDGVVTAPYGVSVALRCDADDFDFWAFTNEDLYPVFYSDEKVCAISSEQQGLIFGWIPKESEWESWSFSLLSVTEEISAMYEIEGGSITEISAENVATVTADEDSETVSVKYIGEESVLDSWELNGEDAGSDNPIEITRESGADGTLEAKFQQD